MSHCIVFECNTGIILIGQKQVLLPKELSCFNLKCVDSFLLPSMFQDYQIYLHAEMDQGSLPVESCSFKLELF